VALLATSPRCRCSCRSLGSGNWLFGVGNWFAATHCANHPSSMGSMWGSRNHGMKFLQIFVPTRGEKKEEGSKVVQM